MNLPKKPMTTNAHLPDHLAAMCAKSVQKPVNPHKQRLVSASARAAKVDVDNKPGKENKAKEKKSAKPKVKVVKPNDAKEMYAAAKKSFFDALLEF